MEVKRKFDKITSFLPDLIGFTGVGPFYYKKGGFIIKTHQNALFRKKGRLLRKKRPYRALLEGLPRQPVQLRGGPRRIPLRGFQPAAPLVPHQLGSASRPPF